MCAPGWQVRFRAVCKTSIMTAQFYKYPHDFPGHFVRQQYLPDTLLGRTYYTFGDNRTEQAARAYREKLERETDA